MRDSNFKVKNQSDRVSELSRLQKVVSTSTPSNPNLLDTRRKLHFVRVFPKQLHSILFPVLGGEQMHHELERVDDCPAAGFRGIHTENLRFLLIEHALNFNPQRAQMRLGGSRHKHKIIGDTGKLAHIEDAE